MMTKKQTTINKKIEELSSRLSELECEWAAADVEDQGGMAIRAQLLRANIMSLKEELHLSKRSKAEKDAEQRRICDNWDVDSWGRKQDPNLNKKIFGPG